MHLNDSFGKGNFDVYYNHHEQACGYAAVGYSKTNNKPSIVCTTSGCAATNAISPCLVAYHDSVPILFISGQINSVDIIQSKTNNIRNYGFSDSTISNIVESMTKYSHEILNINEINDVLSNGLQSGIISDLVYYNDTLAFYKRYKKEIDILLKDIMNETGSNSPADVFGKKWDKEDFFIQDTNNRNLLAWFGFEEKTRELADKLGY